MKEIFIKEALKNIAKDWDIADESCEFEAVMNEYEDYFTFKKVETEEEKNRAYKIIDRLFIYLYPTLGGSRSDYMSSAIATAAYETGTLIEISKEAYSLIKDRIEMTALNHNRAIRELEEVGVELD